MCLVFFHRGLRNWDFTGYTRYVVGQCKLQLSVNCKLQNRGKMQTADYRLLFIVLAEFHHPNSVIQANRSESLHSGQPFSLDNTQVSLNNALVGLYMLALNDGNGNTIQLKSLHSVVCILPLVCCLYFTLSLHFNPIVLTEICVLH